MTRRGRAFSALMVAIVAAVPTPAAERGAQPSVAHAASMRIASHRALYDGGGRLLPWISWNTALDREMAFYETAADDHGYPIFATTTFLAGDWTAQAERVDTIPATQDGMGIVSYLKFYVLRERRNARTLALARAMGDYLVAEAQTPDTGAYPRFTRSTGRRGQFPQPPDAGSQSDRPYEIEPDKGGIAGYALLQLYDETRDERFLAQARHNARVLAAQQRPGNATHSPWPFRADYRDGAARGAVSGNLVYILRLYDGLIARGDRELEAPRGALWHWIKHTQIPDARHDGRLFAQFFEDHDHPANRTAWAPLNLARYLLERRDALDRDWLSDAGVLIAFVRRTFLHREAGVMVCHEQDEDRDAWGGINSTYGAVLALYARATGSVRLAREAREALNFTEYSIDDAGRPRDLASHATPGGWQEDAHTDVVHNFVDAIGAFPEWAQ